MESAVCKRVAKSFELQRYVPEYQVYELCINWVSEIPTPPTIFYLSEVFIYPYMAHPTPKRELTLPRNKVLLDSDTLPDHDASLLNSKLQDASLPSCKAADAPAANRTGKSLLAHSQAEVKEGRVLDYDRVVMGKEAASEIKARNRLIVKRTPYKPVLEAKKRRKT